MAEVDSRSIKLLDAPRAGRQSHAPRHEKSVRSDGFLPELQALRALAVSAVALYHLWPGIFPGGFVGVDVFFAVSGFLITTHLIKPLIAGHRISVLRFWSNRIWRLLPASLFVLVVCWFFTWRFTPITVAADAFHQIGAAASYVVNWVLASDSVDYLAHDNAPTIVQHYWSLSVEEQFYLVWPILLTLAVVIGTFLTRHRSKRGSPFTALIVAIGLVVASSFVYSVIGTRYSPASSYFNTFTRVWEFALGALTAVFVLRDAKQLASLRAHPLVKNYAIPTWTGIALIVSATFTMSGSTSFPSGWAAIPVLGAVSVIVGGMPRRGPLVAAILWRPVQWLGDVSYSVYLWHWPLIVGFSLVVGREHGLLEGLGLLAASLFLASFSKRCIEDPLRRFGRSLSHTWPAFVLALVGAGLLLGGGMAINTQREVAAHAAAVQREEHVSSPGSCLGANATLGPDHCAHPFDLTPGVDPVQSTVDLDTAHWCLTWYNEEWQSCEYGDVTGSHGTIAIVGDSHAASLTNPLGDFLREKGIRLLTFTRYGCPGVSAAEINDQTPEMAQACAAWTRRVTETIASRTDIDMVLYTSFEAGYAQGDSPGLLGSDAITATLQRVSDSGKDVVVLRDFPSGHRGADVPTCVAQATSVAKDCSVDRATALPPEPAYDQAIAALGDRVRTVDMRDAYCDASRCYAVIGDVIAYADDNHVSKTFAQTLVPYLFPQLDFSPLP